MKTILEIWNETPERLRTQLKVRPAGWDTEDYFCVKGQSPAGQFMGYSDKGDAGWLKPDRECEALAMNREIKINALVMPGGAIALYEVGSPLYKQALESNAKLITGQPDVTFKVEL